MSDAIEFGLGGNNKGFVAVLNDSEKKAKESGDRIKKEQERSAKEAERAAAQAQAAAQKAEKERSKSKADLIRDLSQVRSGGDAIGVAFSQMGAGMRVGAASAAALVAAGAALVGTWAAVARNSKEAYETQLAMERIGRINIGGTGNRSTSDLEQNLAVIREEREKNKQVINGMAQGLFGEQFLKAGGQNLKEALARTGSAVSEATGGPGFEVQTPAQREETLRKSEEEAMKRIAQKQSEIWAIERVRIIGARETAELLELQVRYAERIDAARREGQKSGSTALADQLTKERDDARAAIERRQEEERLARDTRTRNSYELARNADLAVGSTAEEEQRRSNVFREDAAQRELYDAQQAEINQPENKERTAARYIAEKQLQQVIAENAKWERDIARSKGDAVKMTKAGSDALSAELRGQRHLSELIKQRATNELAIVQAQRAGNSELVKQLQVAGQIERKAIAQKRVTDGSGRSMRPSDVRSQIRREEMTGSEADRAVNRIFDADGNLKKRAATVGNQPRRERIHGAVSRLEPLGIEGQNAQRGSASNAGPGIPSVNGTPAEAWRSRFPKSQWAKTEMDNRKDVADIGASRQERADSEAKAREERLTSGGATAEEAMAAAVQILTKWDQNR